MGLMAVPVPALGETLHFQVFACACPLPEMPLPVSTPMSAHENTIHSSMPISTCAFFHNALFALQHPRCVWLCLWAPSGCTSSAALPELTLSFIVTLNSHFILLCLIPICVESLQGQDLWFIYSYIPRASINVYWWYNDQASKCFEVIDKLQPEICGANHMPGIRRR